MTKIIQSPVKRFPGTVVLTDPLTLPMAMAFEAAMDEQVRRKTAGETYSSKLAEPLIPVVCQVVAEWHLENFPEQVTPETFPGSPRLATRNLIDWLVGEIATEYLGEDEIPL